MSHPGSKLDAYVDGSLGAEGRREVEEHTRGCEACAKELAALKALSKDIQVARPEAPRTSFRSYWDRLLGRHGEVKTMTAIQRLTRVVESNIHAAIDGMEDPAKMIRQLVREMEDALAGARDELAESMALQARLERRAGLAEESARDWDSKAALALRHGREDLARESLREKLRQESLAGELKEEAALQKGRVAQLQAAFDRACRQLDEIRRRKALWLAQASRRVGGARSQEAYRAAYAELARIVAEVEGRLDVEAAQARIEAPASLEDSLAGMAEGDALDREMEALKKRLQKQPN